MQVGFTAKTFFWANVPVNSVAVHFSITKGVIYNIFKSIWKTSELTP